MFCFMKKFVSQLKTAGLLKGSLNTLCIALIIMALKETDAVHGGSRPHRVRSEKDGLSCFTCVSINGTDEDCDDPVQPAWMNPTQDCKTPVPVDYNHTEYEKLNETIKSDYEYFAERVWKKERAKFCLKVVGTSESRESIIIRTCITEDMNSQCGSFKFRGRKIRGCMLTCSDALCNGAPGRVTRLFNAGFYTGLNGLIPFNSMLMEILLGIRLGTMIPLLFLGADVFFGDVYRGWWWNEQRVPLYLYAGG